MKNTQRSHEDSRTRRQRRELRRRARAFRRFMMGIGAVLVTAICIFSIGSFSEAHESQDTLRAQGAAEDRISCTHAEDAGRYYKSIQIEEGDTLWSIAEEHTDGTLDAICQYMDELAAINRLSYTERDTLQAGDYLLIAYCDTEP